MTRPERIATDGELAGNILVPSGWVRGRITFGERIAAIAL